MSLEDFTTYTEVDDGNRLTVTTNKIVVSLLQRGEPNEHVYFDYGASFFDGDFTHKNQHKVTRNGNGQIGVWSLSNTIGDFTPTLNILYVAYIGLTLSLVEKVSGVKYTDNSINLSVGTQYYTTYIRDESIGSFGQLQCFLYDDVDRTSLLDTLSLTLHSKVDWRYVYGVQGSDIGTGTVSSDMIIENLDLGLAAAAAGGQIINGGMAGMQPINRGLINV